MYVISILKDATLIVSTNNNIQSKVKNESRACFNELASFLCHNFFIFWLNESAIKSKMHEVLKIPLAFETVAEFAMIIGNEDPEQFLCPLLKPIEPAASPLRIIFPECKQHIFLLSSKVQNLHLLGRLSWHHELQSHDIDIIPQLQ